MLTDSYRLNAVKIDLHLSSIFLIVIFLLLVGCEGGTGGNTFNVYGKNITLGKPVDDGQVNQFISDIPLYKHGKFTDTSYYSNMNKGVSLKFNNNKILTHVFLYSGRRGGIGDLFGTDQFRFSKYSGQLPHGISFSDTRNDVERKYGLPDKSVAQGFHARYNKLNLTVEYKVGNKESGNDVIEHFIFH